MGRFGFSKNDDDNGAKASLFSRKKNSGNQDANPYAQQNQQGDPYATPTSAVGLPTGPRGGRPGQPSGPGASTGGVSGPAPYGNMPPVNNSYGSGPQSSGSYSAGGGYSASGYGASSGYGNRNDAYNSSSNSRTSPSYGMNGSPSSLGRPPSYRSTADSAAPGGGSSYGGNSSRTGARRGGYGGLGGRDEDTANDLNRQALFGDAPQKLAEQQQQQQAGHGTAGGGGYGDSVAGGYGEGQELTEEDEVRQIKEETKDVRQKTEDSLNNSQRIADDILERALHTRELLGEQRRQMFNAQDQLNQAAVLNDTAKFQTKQLKHYNGSMFAPKNPFMSKKRKEEQAQEALNKHHEARAAREATRQARYQGDRIAEEHLNKMKKPGTVTKQDRANVSKFVFYDEEGDGEDDEDVEAELRINDKIQNLSSAVGNINLAAKIIGETLDEDRELIDNIGEQTHRVDNEVQYNRTLLDRAAGR